jgi:hypothetical protein
MWWYPPGILPLRKGRQEDLEFKASLCYIARPCLKKKKKKKEGREGGRERYKNTVCAMFVQV